MSQLDALAQISDPSARAVTVADYIRKGRASLTAAIEVRDTAIYELLCAGVSPTQIARDVEVSLSHIKLVKRLRAAKAADEAVSA